MADITYSVPGMYADHHVSNVVDALNAVDGISKIVASSSRKKLTITFDSSKVSVERLAQTLDAAGYAVQPVEGALSEEDLDTRKGSDAA